MIRLSLDCGLVAQRREGHASGIVSAIDYIGAPDVVAEGQDLLPDVTESNVAGLETAVAGVGIELQVNQLRINGMAVLQSDDRD